MLESQAGVRALCIIFNCVCPFLRSSPLKKGNLWFINSKVASRRDQQNHCFRSAHVVVDDMIKTTLMSAVNFKDKKEISFYELQLLCLLVVACSCEL